jgi:hypothetical protein
VHDDNSKATEAVPGLDDLPALIERARKGDTTVLPALRRALDSNPEIWRHCGDLATVAKQAWIDLACGPNLLSKESVARKLLELETELAGAEPSPLVRLLAERVAACWLQLHYADALAAQAQNVSLQQAKYMMERQSRAHRRYLQAIATLATVKRLLPPSPQVETVAALPGREGTATGVLERGEQSGPADQERPAAFLEEACAGAAAEAPAGLVLPLGAARVQALTDNGGARNKRRRAARS